jgi:hypothetical protein
MARAKKTKTKKKAKSKRRTVAKVRRAAKKPAKAKTAKRTKTKAPARKAKAPARKANAKALAFKAKATKARRKRKEVLGEGNYTASREFRKEQTDFVTKNRNRIPTMAKEAEKEIEGPQGDELREAEEEAKSHAHTQEAAE